MVSLYGRGRAGYRLHITRVVEPGIAVGLTSFYRKNGKGVAPEGREGRRAGRLIVHSVALPIDGDALQHARTITLAATLFADSGGGYASAEDLLLAGGPA